MESVLDGSISMRLDEGYADNWEDAIDSSMTGADLPGA
jgi:hypothetical protein